MYILDTDVLIWILLGRKDILDKVSALKEKSSLGISVISIAEIYKHIFPAELTLTEEYLYSHKVLDVDGKIAKIAGLYWQQYAKKCKNLSLTDCFIAGTAHAYEATLLSFNGKHFPMKDIRVQHPLK